MHFPEIATPRLTLRAIRESDWPAIFAYMSDSQVTAFLPEGVLDEQAARAFARDHAGEDGKAVAVLEKASGQMIGHMPFHLWYAPETYERTVSSPPASRRTLLPGGWRNGWD